MSGAWGSRSGPPGRPGAFTLIELLTVIAVIAVLAALLGSATTLAMRRVRMTECSSQVRQLGLAVHQYVSDFGDRLPTCARLGPDPAYALPSLQQCLDSYLKDRRVYHCPSDRDATGIFATTGTSYEWNTFVNGMLLDHAKLVVVTLTYNPPLIGDGDAFHGSLGRNYFYADGHVTTTAGSPLE